MKDFVKKNILKVSNSSRRIRVLAKSIFHHTELNLLYQSDANTTASETFRNRAANCLSMTIMTYAMAEFANIDVQFQLVEIPEFWIRREGISLLNRHVNLRLFKKTDLNVFMFGNSSYNLDFDSITQSLILPVKEISKQRVLAMFYNNKGADALINRRYPEAYAYFRASLTTDSLLIDGWNNLGILYRRIGELEQAEAVYHQALVIDDNDLSTLDNLAFLYNMTGRTEQGEKISNRVANKRFSNPYYHLMLGDIEYENKNWQLAIKHYKKAVRLNERPADFYFAIAKSYYQLDELQKSRKYMKLAKKHTKKDYERLLYQRKIDLLTSMN